MHFLAREVDTRDLASAKSEAEGDRDHGRAVSRTSDLMAESTAGSSPLPMEDRMEDLSLTLTAMLKL